MDLGQIKYAALGPYRWAKRLQRHHEQTESANIGDQRCAVRQLPLLSPAHRYDIEYSRTHSGQRFLVPGGRFLIDANFSPPTVRLLDLGVPGLPALASARLVSQVEFAKPVNQISRITVVPASSSRLRLALTSNQSDGFIVTVLEISPAEEDTAFAQVARLHLDIPLQFTTGLSLRQNTIMVGLGMRQVTLIWDFVSNRYVLWAGESPPLLSFIDNVIFEEQKTGLTAWPITSWNQLPATSAPTLPIAYEQLRIAHGDLSTHIPFPRGCESPSSPSAIKAADWYACNNRLAFDILDWTLSKSRGTGHRYEIEVFKERPYIQISQIATFTLPTQYSHYNLLSGARRVALGFSACSWVSIDLGRAPSLQIGFYSVPDMENSTAGSVNAVVTAIEDNRFEGHPQGLCTGSGRIVSFTRKLDNCSIFDYLSYHPTSYTPFTLTRRQLQMLKRAQRLPKVK